MNELKAAIVGSGEKTGLVLGCYLCQTELLYMGFLPDLEKYPTAVAGIIDGEGVLLCHPCYDKTEEEVN